MEYISGTIFYGRFEVRMNTDFGQYGVWDMAFNCGEQVADNLASLHRVARVCQHQLSSCYDWNRATVCRRRLQNATIRGRGTATATYSTALDWLRLTRCPTARRPAVATRTAGRSTTILATSRACGAISSRPPAPASTSDGRPAWRTTRSPGTVSGWCIT